MEKVLKAQVRPLSGKAASRRLRRQGYMPAVAYGANEKPESLALALNDVEIVFSEESSFSSILELDIEGKKKSVLVKQVQYHPKKNSFHHIDFLKVEQDKEVAASVPLHFLGEESNLNLRSGAVLTHHLVAIDILCLPKDLPEFIEVNVGDLEPNHSVFLNDITLPQGVKLQDHGSDNSTLAICSVENVRAQATEDETEESELEASDESVSEDSGKDKDS